LQVFAVLFEGQDFQAFLEAHAAVGAGAFEGPHQ
jgi:hypothetical protein